MGQPDLFAWARRPKHYPAAPGWKEETTSRAAAASVAPADKMRAAVLGAIAAAGLDGLTADEAAARVGLSVLSARPRVTELFKQEKIEPTGARRENTSGRKAKVYRVRREP